MDQPNLKLTNANDDAPEVAGRIGPGTTENATEVATEAPAPTAVAVGDVAATQDATAPERATGELPEPPQEEQAAMRTVSLNIPAQMTDQLFSQIVQMGMAAFETASSSGIVMFFPTVIRDEATGQEQRKIGHFRGFISSPEDVRRIVTLTGQIHKANVEVAKAAQRGPGDELTARVIAKTAKDNAERHANATPDKPAIIVAK